MMVDGGFAALTSGAAEVQDEESMVVRADGERSREKTLVARGDFGLVLGIFGCDRE